MHQLAYRPSHLARSLRMQRSFTIGVLVADVTAPGCPQIIQGVLRALRARNYSALVADSEGSTESEADECRRLLARHVDGCIIIPIGEVHDDMRALCHRVPCVLVGQNGADFAACSVLPNLGGAVSVATRWLLRQGPRVALVTHHIPSPQRATLLQAYQRCLETARVGLDPELICTPPPTVEGGYKTMRRLSRTEPPVNGVVTTDPQITIGMLHAWEQLPVDERPSFIGLDLGSGGNAATHKRGQLQVPHHALGVRAVGALAAAFTGTPPEVLTLPVAFVPPADQREDEADAPVSPHRRLPQRRRRASS